MHDHRHCNQRQRQRDFERERRVAHRHDPRLRFDTSRTDTAVHRERTRNLDRGVRVYYPRRSLHRKRPCWNLLHSGRHRNYRPEIHRLRLRQNRTAIEHRNFCLPTQPDGK